MLCTYFKPSMVCITPQRWWIHILDSVLVNCRRLNYIRQFILTGQLRMLFPQIRKGLIRHRGGKVGRAGRWSIYHIALCCYQSCTAGPKLCSDDYGFGVHNCVRVQTWRRLGTDCAADLSGGDIDVILWGSLRIPRCRTETVKIPIEWWYWQRSPSDGTTPISMYGVQFNLSNGERQDRNH